LHPTVCAQEVVVRDVDLRNGPLTLVREPDCRAAA